MIEKIRKAFLTMFGIGNVPPFFGIGYAPGTIASLITCLIYYNIPFYGFNYYIGHLAVIFLLIIFAIPSIDKYIKKNKEKDPKEIVIDEFIGQYITLFVLYSSLKIKMALKFDHGLRGAYIDESLVMEAGRFKIYLLCFVLFRVFDILKPYPINLIDKKIKNGTGVVLDDIIASIYAAITAFIIIYLTPWQLWK